MPLGASPSAVWEDGKPWSSPVVTVVTLERPFLAVPKTNVISQGGGQRAGHVTQRALVMVHCAKQWVENITTKQGKAHTLQSLSWEKGPLLTMVPHMVTEQPLCGKPLGAVRTLKPLLCSMKAREKGEGVVRKEIKAETTAQKEGKRGSYSRAGNPSLQADTADTDYKAKQNKQIKSHLQRPICLPFTQPP